MDSASGTRVLDIQDGIVRNIDTDGASYDLSVEGVVVPGLVDAHNHVGIDVGDEHAQAAEPLAVNLMRGVRNLERSLLAGVTTIRNCGERPGAEPVWIRALAEGWIRGPRLVGANEFLCRTGGHSWYSAHQVDGPDSIRRTVRENVRDGACFIKVAATGGMATSGSDVGRPEFTFAELAALVEEAHRLGVPVGAHAYGGQGADDALTAGVDVIEHGSLFSDDQFARAAQAGVAVVITGTIIPAFLASDDVPWDIKEKMAPFARVAIDAAARAKAAGVTVGVGTDGVHGDVVGELELLLEAGFSRIEALEVGTRVNAEITRGVASGQIQPGHAADLVVLEGDPTQDLAHLRRPREVMLAGNWVAVRTPAPRERGSR
jgi:imidazolonepropionase-like amidohydrolase